MYSIPKQRRRVTIKVLNRLVGGTPSDPKLIEGWLKANMPEVEELERAKLAATTLQEVGSTVDEASKGMWTTFKRDETGIYIEGRQLKAAYKEAANILRDVFMKQERKGKDESAKAKSRFTALRSKLAERLFIEEAKVHMRDEAGELMLKPSGTEERPIHVLTPQGPRTALKKFDYATTPTLSFHIWWMDDGIIGDDILMPMLEYMGANGLGADRSQGEGIFEVVEVVPA